MWGGKGVGEGGREGPSRVGSTRSLSACSGALNHGPGALGFQGCAPPFRTGPPMGEGRPARQAALLSLRSVKSRPAREGPRHAGLIAAWAHATMPGQPAAPHPPRRQPRRHGRRPARLDSIHCDPGADSSPRNLCACSPAPRDKTQKSVRGGGRQGARTCRAVCSACLSWCTSSTVASHSFWNNVSRPGMEVAGIGRGLAACRRAQCGGREGTAS